MPSSYDHLTAREREVVTLLAPGLTAKEVAAALGIAPGTVEKHVETIMIKLRARNRLQMALIAAADGVIDPTVCRTRMTGGEVPPRSKPVAPRSSSP